MSRMLWEERLEGQAVPLTMPELYQTLERLLESLKQSPPTRDEVRLQARGASTRLGSLLDALPSEPSLLEGQNLTLEALRLGMTRAVADGVELFLWDETPSSSLDIELAPNREMLSLLQKNITQIVELAQSNWSQAHPDDIYLLCEYGKHQNLASLEEGGRAATDGSDFQKFLLASFKGGYAIGLAQTAVTYKC